MWLAHNTAFQQHFGYSVALNGAGNLLAVGAWLENGSGFGVNPQGRSSLFHLDLDVFNFSSSFGQFHWTRSRLCVFTL